MIASMTAFARAATQQTWGQATWEVRSVNHRYLDLTIKVPENFREWELSWRQVVSKTLQRGKVECFLNFMPSELCAPQLRVNNALVSQLLANCQIINQIQSMDTDVKAMDLLRWPGVLITEPGNVSHLKEPLTELLEEALQDLSQARLREGKQLQLFFAEKLKQVLKHVTLVKEKMPLCIQAQKQKLLQRLSDISQNLDKDRLEQEMVFYAQRSDVEEEIIRLVTHVKEVELALQAPGATGRRLDFLMQEMNREANTLGAKAGDESVTKASVELKVLIEQMREQIQNVE